MKKLVSMVLIFFACQAMAQVNQVVKLKNGSEIRGVILKEDPEKVSIQTRDGSVWTYKQEEIESIGTYQPKVSGPGYYFRSSLGIMGGDQISPSLQIINGYSFNSHWDLGFGVGLESFYWDRFVPLFVEGRYNLLNKPFTPFVTAVAGYEMPIENWDFINGGFTCGGRVGFTKNLGTHVAFSTSLGYRFAYLNEKSPWWDDFITIREINRFDLRFGITIK